MTQAHPGWLWHRESWDPHGIPWYILIHCGRAVADLRVPNRSKGDIERSAAGKPGWYLCWMGRQPGLTFGVQREPEEADIATLLPDADVWLALEGVQLPDIVHEGTLIQFPPLPDPMPERPQFQVSYTLASASSA
jgi:hypothetical protein